MNRRTFLAEAGTVLGTAFVTQAARIAWADEPESKALALHRSVGVFDAYTKPALKLTRGRFEPGQFIERVESLQAQLWRLREGQVRIANMSIGVPRYQAPSKVDGQRPT